MPCILLVDNGSYRASAALKLRSLAEQLSVLSGKKIHPVSCQHSNQIPASELDGQAATIFAEFMQQQLAAGEKQFIVLPLFFGRSRAITAFIPKEASALEQTYGTFELQIADVIYPLPKGESELTDIIYEHTLSCSAAAEDKPGIKTSVLVDHGSPVPRVTAVRQQLADSVRKKLDSTYLLEEAVMERREGEKYDFNGELLHDWLQHKAQSGESHVAVILMFFLPGSHAGEGGDIIEICQSVVDKYADFQVTISPLIGEHTKLVSILNKRLRACLPAL